VPRLALPVAARCVQRNPTFSGRGQGTFFFVFFYPIQPISSYLFPVDLSYSFFVLFFCQGGVAQLCRQFFWFGSKCLLCFVIWMGELGFCLLALYE